MKKLLFIGNMVLAIAMCSMHAEEDGPLIIDGTTPIADAEQMTMMAENSMPLAMSTDDQMTNNEEVSLAMSESEMMAELEMSEPEVQEDMIVVQEPSSLAKMRSGKTVMEALADRPQYSIFMKALETTGLKDELNEGDSVTMFAFSNAAFKRLSPHMRDMLSQDQDKLRAFMKRHIVVGRRLDDPCRYEMELATVDGKTITISQPRCDLLIEGHMSHMMARINASNGEIYAMDSIVMPPNKKVASSPAKARYNTVANALRTNPRARMFMSLMDKVDACKQERGCAPEECLSYLLEHGENLVVLVPQNRLLKEYKNGDITYVERLLRSHVIENKSPCSVLQNDIVLRTMADDELHIMQQGSRSDLCIQGHADVLINGGGVCCAENGVMLITKKMML